MYKRILTVQDISCVGQCSMTVALPILSACGIETCILPTAILSTHTGGFTGFTFRDLSSDLPKIHEHWKKEGITFDAVYTGYLGSVDDVSHVIRISDELKTPEGKLIVDPAMGDNGKLYTGFDEKYVDAMRSLCEKADILLPNMTEASLLLDEPCPERLTEAEASGVLLRLKERFCADVVLTGVGFAPEETGVSYLCGDNMGRYAHRLIGRSFHGTGDIYAAAFTGALVRGRDIPDSARIAADYVLRCIESTKDSDEHWYGVRFELAIPELLEMLK